MVVQKRRPPFRRFWISRGFPLPAQYSSLGSIEAKHFQLAMNARRAPGRVLRNHAGDEFAQFPADMLSSHGNSMPRKPRPIQLEPRTMPANDSLRLDKDQCAFPSRPEPPQDHPE